MSATSSRLRQRIQRLAKQYQDVLERVLAGRGPLVRGSFGSRARVCGKPNCRCTRGELHRSKYLTATDGGKVRQVHVPASDEMEVAAGVARYRAFQKARRRLAQLSQKQLELIEELGRSLLKPYPPERPLPPPQRRGRRSSKKEHGHGSG